MRKVTLYQLHSHTPLDWKSEGFNQMMSYVILTGNGKLIVIDGGYSEEADYLIELLTRLGGKKPTVTCWLMTHMHNDHVSAFTEIMKNHRDKIDVEAIYYNFPKREEIAQYENGSSLSTYDAFFENFSFFKEKVHIVNTGETIIVDDVRIEVLFVPNNRYVASKNLNNSSVVYRMEACGQSILFLGDLAESAQNDLLQEVSENKIKADIVQMAHHGQWGVQRCVYEAVKPKCCLWCTPDWLWNNDAGQGYNTHGWQTVIVRKWMKELGVKHHLVEKNGTESLVLPADFNDFSWGQEEEPE